MGQYNKAVLTSVGENLIARALAGEIQLNITMAKTSNFIYPAGTDFKALTDMQGIKQTAADPATAVYDNTMIQTRVLFSNEEILSTYYIQNIGLYAMDGTEEVLFCIVTAETPDEMPQYSGVASTSYIYNIQNVVQDADQLSITVNPSGTATIQDVLERVDATGGDISETVIETLDTVEDKYPVPAAGESVKRFFGKVLTFLRNIKPLTGNINIYVSTTGSDTTGDGTSENPFKTIQHAIDIVPKDLGGHTATIYINDGVYAERLEINGFSAGIIYLRCADTEVVSDNVTVSYIDINFCSSMVAISGIKVNNSSDDSSIRVATNSNVLLNNLKITTLAPDKVGVLCAESNLVRIAGCDITGKLFAIRYVNTEAYIQNCTGANNSYACASGGASVVHVLGTYPGSTYGLTQSSGGSYIYNNGTQISGLISSGLSCTWGTIEAGGYYRHGNLNGVAQIIVNLRINITTLLTGEQPYRVYGFPTYAGYPVVAVATSNPNNTSYCYLGNVGDLVFTPKVNIAAGGIIIFTCTYIVNS